MSTLEDLAYRIDAMAEAQVASAAQIRGAITKAIADVADGLSVDDLNDMPIFGYGLGSEILGGLASTIRATLVTRAQTALLKKVTHNIHPATSINLSISIPVHK